MAMASEAPSGYTNSNVSGACMPGRAGRRWTEMVSRVRRGSPMSPTNNRFSWSEMDCTDSSSSSKVTVPCCRPSAASTLMSPAGSSSLTT